MAAGGWIALGRRIVAVSRREQLTLVSAGVAYYAFVSLVPLSLVAVAAATALDSDFVVQSVTAILEGLLTPSAQLLLADVIGEEAGRRGATVVGTIGILWGASRVFRGIDRAFSRIYGTVAEKSLVGSLADGAVVLLAVTTALLALGAFEAAIALIAVPGTMLVGSALVWLTLVVVFLPLYLVFPGVPIGVREALPGALVAAVGWLVLGRTFAIYAGLAGGYAVYGALGAVFLVLVWLYAGAALIVGGAVVNAVLADRAVDRQLQSPGTRQVRREAMTGDDGHGRDERSDGGDPHDERPGGRDRDGDSDRVDGLDGRRQGRDRRNRPGENATAEPAEVRRGETATSGRTRDRADDPEVLREEIERLRDEIESLERQVDDRTVPRSSVERDLRRYVRRHSRRSHARGWGPYLVLLYGTALAIGAFYFLEGGWAILAMFVVWTSTIGVYVLMVLFGAGISLLTVPGRIRDRVDAWRS